MVHIHHSNEMVTFSLSMDHYHVDNPEIASLYNYFIKQTITPDAICNNCRIYENYFEMRLKRNS